MLSRQYWSNLGIDGKTGQSTDGEFSDCNIPRTDNDKSEFVGNVVTYNRLITLAEPEPSPSGAPRPRVYHRELECSIAAELRSQNNEGDRAGGCASCPSVERVIARIIDACNHPGGKVEAGTSDTDNQNLSLTPEVTVLLAGQSEDGPGEANRVMTSNEVVRIEPPFRDLHESENEIGNVVMHSDKQARSKNYQSSSPPI